MNSNPKWENFIKNLKKLEIEENEFLKQSKFNQELFEKKTKIYRSVLT